MKTYRPGDVPSDPARLAEFLRRELTALQQAAHRAEPFLLLDELHAEPERIAARMVVYADGTDWNPGSGEGMYRRNKANSAWVFLG